jgi:NAD-dependent dihydropyrimidine dehydrogenase PreA subunit
MKKLFLLMLGLLTLSLTLTQCQKDTEVSSQLSGSQLKTDSDFARKVAISSDYIDRVADFYKTAKKEDIQTMRVLVAKLNSITAEQFSNSQETRNEFGGAISLYAALLKYKNTQQYLDYLNERSAIDQLLSSRYKGVNNLQALYKEAAELRLNIASNKTVTVMDRNSCLASCASALITCRNQAKLDASTAQANCFTTHPVQTTCYTAYTGHFINYDNYTVFYTATAQVAYYSTTYVSTPTLNSIHGTWVPDPPYQVCSNNQDAINSLCQQQYNNTLNNEQDACAGTYGSCIASCPAQ